MADYRVNDGFFFYHVANVVHISTVYVTPHAGVVWGKDAGELAHTAVRHAITICQKSDSGSVKLQSTREATPPLHSPHLAFAAV